MKENALLIIQTPNAVALHKRLIMLAGRNPSELIDSSKTGHLREYTGKELKQYAEKVGLSVEKTIYSSYFDYRYLPNPTSSPSLLFLLNLGYRLAPSSLRTGITVILKKST
jgi:hypothetical protein